MPISRREKDYKLKAGGDALSKRPDESAWTQSCIRSGRTRALLGASGGSAAAPSKRFQLTRQGVAGILHGRRPRRLGSVRRAVQYASYLIYTEVR